jgi:hypothetical protein
MRRFSLRPKLVDAAALSLPSPSIELIQTSTGSWIFNFLRNSTLEWRTLPQTIEYLGAGCTISTVTVLTAR